MVQAISGLMSLTGDPDGPPYRAGISVFDVMAGLHANIGILAALHHRDSTGRGQHVEVNLLSSALSGLVNHSSGYVAGGTVPVPDGQRAPQPLPVRAAAHRRRRAHRDRRQRRPVPQAVPGARPARAAGRPALRAQPGPHRQPGGAAAAAGRAAAQAHQGRVVPGPAGGRGAVRADQHHRRAASRSPTSSASTPVVEVGGDSGGTQPDHVLRHPGGLPSCRRPAWTSTARRSAHG